MPFINVNQEASQEVKIYYQDIGQGKPVVFISGWPSNSQMWESQLDVLPKNNIRCIAYDRRGFGKSDKPWESYDYDALTSDLDELLKQLDLRELTLVGFSMGGGEVARYLSKYNSEGRVTKAILVSTVLPFLLKTDNNPEGLPQEMFAQIEKEIYADRPKFLANFAKDFYSVSLLNKTVSDDFLNANQIITLQSNGNATVKAMRSWSTTDFREDIKKINVPTLIIHGTDDKTVPIEVSSDRTADMLPQAKYIKYDGAPHGLFYTEKEKLNNDIFWFVNEYQSINS
ncbi:alpha/beta fold hydrolase [Flavobacterium macacae]|uniref:Alpha/beta hydrolase n=1 Tax=Flavobacterium macacae TaxID=2488993 RepID=A0A3P3WAT0_9FLAO|nr:alpha/beta hydrolase [Flavobacterium macacae]RRJ90709.1 alpha/beta hydrolase [Flavobacterium macacae]